MARKSDKNDDSAKLKDMISLWDKFAAGKDFELNPDVKHVSLIYKGLMENRKKYGMMLCPCRLRDGTGETDLKLMCPCNFKAQEIWVKEGRCWCGLFIKINLF